MSTGMVVASVIIIILAISIVILYACLCVASDAEMRAEEMMKQMEEPQEDSKEKEIVEDGKDLEV